MRIKKGTQPHPIKIEIKEEEGVMPTPPQVNHRRQPKRGNEADPIEIKEEEPSNIKEEPLKKEETPSTVMKIEPKEESDARLDQASKDAQKRFQFGLLNKVIRKKRENYANSTEEIKKTGPIKKTVRVAKKDRKRHTELLKQLKIKYLKKLEETQEKQMAKIELMRTAIESIKKNKDIPNELFRKVINFKKIAPNQGFIENDNNNQQEPQTNIGEPDFKSLLPKIRSTLNDYEDQVKSTEEVINVLTGILKPNMKYLDGISKELPEKYDN